MRYGKYSGRGNFFSLPNEVFLLGLSAGELAVYSFLKRCENRKTHQCWPSIKTIGQAVGMSENTVRKYIRRLEERDLITTEPTRQAEISYAVFCLKKKKAPSFEAHALYQRKFSETK